MGPCKDKRTKSHPAKDPSVPVCEQFPYPQGDVKRPITFYVPITEFKY